MFYLVGNIIMFLFVAFLTYSAMVDTAKTLNYFTSQPDHSKRYIESNAYKRLCDYTARAVLVTVILQCINIAYIIITVIYFFATKD